MFFKDFFNFHVQETENPNLKQGTNKLYEITMHMTHELVNSGQGQIPKHPNAMSKHAKNDTFDFYFTSITP